MIIVGKLLSLNGVCSDEEIIGALNKVISAKRADMLEVNKKALTIGAEF